MIARGTIDAVQVKMMANDVDSIDRVLVELDDIIEWSRSTSSCLGYFPALYRKVTAKVKDGIEQGLFEDGPRMERLDVVFANRYLSAIRGYRRNEPVSDAWLKAFSAADAWSPIVLQHLLLGINAHINLDLGIAAAHTAVSAAPAAGSAGLAGFRNDFNRINEILASLVGSVENELTEIWPTLRVFSRFLGNTQTVAINFSMKKARDHAWSVAEELATLDIGRQDAAIARIDRGVATLADAIRNPGVLLGTVTRIVRLGERGAVPAKIDILR